VPNQPSFYLAPRTLLQAGVSYRSKHWNLTAVVHNLANRDYIRGAANRNSIEPGEPRNVSAQLERRW
jgi:iron complex outermembrane receptor protein